MYLYITSSLQLGNFYIRSSETGEVIKSSEEGEILLEMPRLCRWLDAGKYFQWTGEVLVNDLGHVLSLEKICLTYDG